MHYLVDGYNMLFRLMHAAKGDLKSHREAIIRDLNQKISLLKLDVTVVFDATYQLGESSRTHFHQLEILFTAEGETADEFILEEVKQAHEPHKEIVITSDKGLAYRVRMRHGQTQSVEEFLLWLNRAFKNKRRQDKKGNKASPLPSSAIAPQLMPPQSTKTTPGPKVSLEQCSAYYEQVFATQWEILTQQERPTSKLMPRENKPPPRRPKKPVDPFQSSATVEPDTVDEMERWLKIFEKLSNSD